MLVPAILISLEQSTPSALRTVPPRHRPITPAVNLPCTLANSNRLQNHTLAHGSREYPRAFLGSRKKLPCSPKRRGGIRVTHGRGCDFGDDSSSPGCTAG